MTTIWDFEAQMVKEGRIQDYALTDAPIQGDGLPNNVTVIAPLGDGSGGWTVFFTEKGNVDDQRYFASESEACNFVLDRDRRNPNIVTIRNSPERRARAQRLAEQSEAEYVEVLRARGLDSHGRPLQDLAQGDSTSGNV